MLLIHAGVGDRSMWRECVGWLADAGFRAIAIDLPGFGEAAVGDCPQAPWEDVLETISELDLTGAALVGNSFGAAVALRVAAAAPAAVSKLMLVSPPPLNEDPSPGLAAAWEAEEAALERRDVDGAVAAVLDAWLQPDAPDALRERVAVMQRRAIELQMAAPNVPEAPDPLVAHPEAVERLSMPVLAVAGKADLPDFKLGAEQIAGQVAHGRCVLMEGAGHLAPLEVPDDFKWLLLEFLREE